MHTKAPGKQKPHGQLQKASNFGQEVEKNAAPSVSHKKLWLQNICLVSTHMKKYDRQNGNLPQIGVKIPKIFETTI